MNAVLDRRGNEIKVGSMVKAKGSSIVRLVTHIDLNSGPNHDAVVLNAQRVDKSGWTRLLANNAEVVA
jgi:hypothetical protein